MRRTSPPPSPFATCRIGECQTQSRASNSISAAIAALRATSLQMSDEQRIDDEIEVEGHGTLPPKYGVNDEPAEDTETDVEAHVHRVSNVRMDLPSNS